MAFQSLLLLQSDGSLPELGVGRSARRGLGDGSARRQRRRRLLAVLRRRRGRPVARRQVRRAQATVGLGRVAGLAAEALGGVGDGRGRVEHGPRRSRWLDVRLVLVVLVALLVRRRRGVEADRRHGQHERPQHQARRADAVEPERDRERDERAREPEQMHFGRRLELAVDVAEQEEVPDGEHSSSDVAATHDERQRPRHRHDEHDGHDG